MTKKITKAEFISRVVAEFGRMPVGLEAVPCTCSSIACRGHVLAPKPKEKPTKVISIDMHEKSGAKPNKRVYRISLGDYRRIRNMFATMGDVPVLGEGRTIQAVLKKYKPLITIDRSY
jgi:hypothetical protein